MLVSCSVFIAYYFVSRKSLYVFTSFERSSKKASCVILSIICFDYKGTTSKQLWKEDLVDYLNEVMISSIPSFFHQVIGILYGDK